MRWGDTLDTTHLPVREFSQSEFLILSGDVVKVFALMAFDDKLVENTELFDPDGVPVGTYNSAPPPLACSGGLDAGFVDGYETGTVLTYRTVTTDGSQSLILDPTSTPGNLSHLWTLPTGVTFAPGNASTDVSPTLRVTVGEYTVYHDVTDNDNSQTWRQCPTYSVYDGVTRSPVNVIMESAPSGDAESGWSCTFRAVDFLSLTDAPDGSLVAFFVRQRINGSWQSLGGTPGRAAIKLVGYLSHDESDLTPQLQYQRFEVISPLARLAMFPGYSKLLIQSVTPDDWSRTLALTTLRAIIQLMRMYTFVLDGVHDLNVSALYLNLAYPELWLQKESPRQQVNELADGTDARLTGLRGGLFLLGPQMSLLSLTDRATLTPVYTFAQRDVARLVARRNQLDTVEMLELHATLASSAGDINAVGAYFSRSPGSPGHGAEFITIERIIVDATTPQDDTNTRAGRRYGMRNGVYTDSVTGAKRRAPEVDLEMREVYDFLDFDDQIVRFASFPNPRDVDLTAFDWTLSRVRLDYASGKVISTFQALTDSPPGESYFPPEAAVIIPPPPPLVYPVLVPAPDPPLTYQNQIAAVTDGNYLVRTTNFKAASPTWTAIDLTASPYNLATYVYDFVPDAFSPLYLGTGMTVNGWILTNTGIYRITDIFGTVALTLQTSFTSASFGAIQTERARQGLVVAHLWRTSATPGSTVVYSLDSGATWNIATGAPPTAFGAPLYPAIYLDPHGGAVRAIFLSSAAPTSAGYVLNLGTGAWTADTSVNFTGCQRLGAWLTSAYSDPNTFYTASSVIPALGPIIMVQGAAQTDISPTYSGTPYNIPGALGKRFIHFDDSNADLGILVARDASGGAAGVWKCTSRSAGAPVWVNIDVPNVSSVAPLAACTNVGSVGFVWGDAAIYTYNLSSGTRTDKTGNLLGSGVGYLINICGGAN